ncbi:hypothetical protein B5G33_15315 [Blautia sp. An81]|nr:hypothetical protein B5G33_15315 [Blautia sp. An81]
MVYLGIMVTDQGIPLVDPYNSAFFGELAREIQKNGYDLMLHYIKDYSEVNYCLKSWKVAGAVFIGSFDDNIRQIQEDNHIPLVFIGPEAIGNGVIMHRLQGFCSYLREAGIQLPSEHIINLTGQNIEDILKMLKKAPHPVTGIFTTADNCAFEIYGAAYRLGYRIPEDFSVIGFDDNSMSRRAIPPLTTIRQDICQKAQLACQMLMKKIEDAKSPAENIILDVDLIERESVLDLSL